MPGILGWMLAVDAMQSLLQIVVELLQALQRLLARAVTQAVLVVLQGTGV